MVTVKLAVAYIGARESSGVRVGAILQLDGGSRPAGAGPDEEAGGNASVKHFGNQILRYSRSQKSD